MPKTTSKKVRDFLQSTGFPFEMKVARQLEKSGYEVALGKQFYDLGEGKMREFDILATKKINDIEVKLIIECKHSDRDNWVFVAPEKKPGRFWTFVKHQSKIDWDDFKKCFNKLHIFNNKISLTNNFVTYDGNKKSDNSSVKDAIYKSIKALINQAHNDSSVAKIIYFPVVMFSGEMFVARYQNQLSVRKENYLHYKIDFIDSDYDLNQDDKKGEDFIGLGIDSNFYAIRKKESIIDLKNTYNRLQSQYQIDFVTERSLYKYLKEVEKGINTINHNFWKIKKDDS